MEYEYRSNIEDDKMIIEGWRYLNRATYVKSRFKIQRIFIDRNPQYHPYFGCLVIMKQI